MQKGEKKQPGTLYGIGVGPGDPELISIKAVRIIQKVQIIFSASSTKNQYSLAVKIVSPYLPGNTPIHMLPFPMTKEKKVAESAWQDHARQIQQELEKGKDAAFLTLGDPMTYSTFGYLVRVFKKNWPHLDIQTIPGITSYQAAAAATNTPLVEGQENLLLLSGVNGGEGLRRQTDSIDNIVFLKAYKNISDIIKSIKETGHLNNSLGVIRCGFPEQEIVENVENMSSMDPRYWTLIMAKKGKKR